MEADRAAQLSAAAELVQREAAKAAQLRRDKFAEVEKAIAVRAWTRPGPA